MFDKDGIFANLTFVKSVVRTSCTLRNKKTGEVKRYAGTVDLIAYDSNGDWYLFDVKSFAIGSKTLSPQVFKTKLEENRQYWSNQLSLYSKSLEAKYGIKFKKV